MAAGRTNVSRSSELALGQGRPLDTGRRRDARQYGRDLDDKISHKGGSVMGIERTSEPLQKKRKVSPISWDKEPVNPEFNDSPAGMNSSLTNRTDSSDDQEPGQLEEVDFDNVPNILTSRWASDEELQDEDLQAVKEKKSRDTPESGVDNDDILGVDEVNDEKAFTDTDMESDDIVLPRTSEEPTRNTSWECRSVSDYENLGKISEGSYGIVFKARDKSTGDLVALKKLKMGKEKEGFPLYYLREINIMTSFEHPAVLGVKEIVVDDSDDGFGNVYMVMEYMEHDLKTLLQSRKQPFSQSEAKCLMLQLLEGVKYLHDNWVLHRDLKTANLLLNNQGDLKICDYGMSRQYGSPLRPYTALVVTLWYRAPELLLGAKEYSTAVDMWSVGCIMAELLAGEPLFDGRTEVEQLKKVIETLGTPSEKNWPGYSHLPGAKFNHAHQPHNLLRKKFPRSSFTGSPVLSDLGLDLLSKLLTYDPKKRITAEDALNHAWFHEVPLPKSKEFMPTFPVSSFGMR